MFCFGPASEAKPTTYRSYPVPPEISMDRVLYRACQDLVELKREGIEAMATDAIGPAAAAKVLAWSAADPPAP